MKKTILIIILISVSTLLHAQQQFTKDQEAQQTIVEFFEAISNRDSVSLKAYSSPYITLYEYGQVWNLDTLIRKTITMNQVADFMRTNSFQYLSTTTSKSTAWLTYRLTSNIFRNGKQSSVEWLKTVVLAKHKKRWKVSHLHSTLLKRS